VPPRSIDTFLKCVQRSSTFDELFALYGEEMRHEGYQNVVFARLGGRDEFEVPWGDVPEGIAGIYFQERLWEADPILAASRLTSRPFTWADELIRSAHSEAAQRVMELARNKGVKGGLTLPFHGPDGRFDIVSLSMRDGRALDPTRIVHVHVKTYAMWQRYLDLDSQLRDATSITGTFSTLLSSRNRAKGPPEIAASVHPQSGPGVGTVADAECQALVLVDVSRRRYRAGLVDLNNRVEGIIGGHRLQGYIDRGLIEEEADDNRFCFYFKPSPVGQSHVKRCPCVPAIRDQVWRQHVDMHEVLGTKVCCGYSWPFCP
jgi:hypothetical protein